MKTGELVPVQMESVYRGLKLNSNFPLSHLCRDIWTLDEITDKNFPLTEFDEDESERQIGTFHLDLDLTQEDVIARMKMECYRQATIREMVCFGILFPKIQLQTRVIALGQVAQIDGSRMVGYLGNIGKKTAVSLCFFDKPFPASSRFLGIYIGH